MRHTSHRVGPIRPKIVLGHYVQPDYNLLLSASSSLYQTSIAAPVAKSESWQAVCSRLSPRICFFCRYPRSFSFCALDAVLHATCGRLGQCEGMRRRYHVAVHVLAPGRNSDVMHSNKFWIVLQPPPSWPSNLFPSHSRRPLMRHNSPTLGER